MRLAALNRAYVQPVATDNKARKDRQDRRDHIAEASKKVQEQEKDSFEVLMDRLGAGAGGVAAILFAILILVNVWRELA
jgi:hypothetical protein